ncbi:DUF6671 family protein [Leptolyngbya sp. AN02str]
MHQKDVAIQPVLEQSLGVKCVTCSEVNTDQFGTFTREVKRLGTMLDAARAKIEAAKKLISADLFLASEGSFGPHPDYFFLQSNYEILLLVDMLSEFEVMGEYRTSNTVCSGKSVASLEEAIAFATEHNFPHQGIILRPTENSPEHIYKELATLEELKEKFTHLQTSLGLEQLYLETDLRAHRNPARMQAIGQATLDLVEKIRSECPNCNTPGFRATSVERGLPCAWCGYPTSMPLYTIYTCTKCNHTEKRKFQDLEFADPGFCNHCNP